VGGILLVVVDAHDQVLSFEIDFERDGRLAETQLRRVAESCS